MTFELVVVEGPDCSGKTTLAKEIAASTGAVYFHCTYTEPLGLAMRDYQHNVLENALLGIERGEKWVIDRLWPSEVVYSKIFRTHMHPDAIKMAEELHAMVTSVDSIYIYCCDSEVVARHETMQDPEHPYPRDKFNALVDAYDAWYEGMHEDYLRTYNMVLEGKDLQKWIRQNL